MLCIFNKKKNTNGYKINHIANQHIIHLILGQCYVNCISMIKRNKEGRSTMLTDSLRFYKNLKLDKLGIYFAIIQM